MLKFRRLFLLLFFQGYFGYAIKGEPENNYHTLQSIENLDTDVSNVSATDAIDLPEKIFSVSQSNDTESLKTTFLSSRIGGHESDESQTKVTENFTNKTINQSTNHTDIMFSKIGVRGGKTGGSKVGGSKTKVGGSKTKVGGSKTKVGGFKTKVGGSKTKVGGSKTKVGGSKTKVGGTKTKIGGSKTIVDGGHDYHWRPYTKSSGGGGGGGGVTALWIVLGIAGVCGTGFLVPY